jgi:DNA-binding beta-propeller fold protein YncE
VALSKIRRKDQKVKAQRIVSKAVFGWMLVISCFGPLAPAGTPPAQQGASGYHLIKKLKLGGVGGWDYLAIDPEARRLYISRQFGITVFDVDSDKVVGQISTQRTHGVAIAREFNRGFISVGGNSTVVIFDLKTLAKLGEVKTDPGTDAIIYDPSSKRVFTFNGKEHANSSTAIDAETGKVAGTVKLAGSPEFAGADGAGHVYVNIADKSELSKIDSKTLKVLATWPLAPCQRPSGLAIDAEHRRVFSGCDNKVMTMTDADTGKVVSTVPVGDGVDAARFDPSTQDAFASAGDDGVLTIAHEDSPNKLTVVVTVKTENGARTMEIDPKTHKIYLVTADLRPTPPTPQNPDPYPTVLPDTQRLLILGK